jgi:hypothetical protein
MVKCLTKRVLAMGFLVLLGCGASVRIPAPVRSAVEDSKILSYYSGPGEGSYLILELKYTTQGDLIENWSSITDRLEKVWEALRGEANRIGASKVLVTVESQTDFTIFDFRRESDGTWKEHHRDVKILPIPGGGMLPILEVGRSDRHTPPTFIVRYVTNIDFMDREALKAELDQVANIFRLEAERGGADTMLLIPSEGINTGGSGSFSYRRFEGDGRWYQESELREKTRGSAP